MTEQETTEPGEEPRKDPLPEGSKKVYNFFIEYGKGGKKVDLPCYEVPDKDEKDQVGRYRYYIGWPKTMIFGPLKALVQSSPYWGWVNDYEDDDFYYYYMTMTRQPDEEFPEKQLLKKADFLYRQGQKAYEFISRSGGKS